MRNPFKPDAQILRALKLHSDLFALVLKSQNLIMARLDAITKAQREILKATGMPVPQIDDLLRKAFDATLARTEKGVRESVEEIEKNLPDVEEPDGNGSN